jgi:putative ABC transport system permease protein
MWLLASQEGNGPNFVEIRAAPAVMLADCRTAILGVNLKIKLRSIQPLTKVVGNTLSAERLPSWLRAGFGSLALLLTSLGLYGILACAVAMRAPEFGVRMAMGAGGDAILRMVRADGLLLAGSGMTLGLGAATLLSRLLASWLYGVQPRDPVTFGGAVVVLFLVAAGASYWPARKATTIEPLMALRYD